MECYLGDRWKGHDIVQLPCYGCGKPIQRPLARARTQPRSFCSYSCKVRTLWATKETREKILKGILSSPSLRSEERKKQLTLARANRVFSAVTREKIRQARLRQHFPTKMTGIERLLHEEFVKLDLSFVMHKSMFGRWQPDFVFIDARLIVQADGDYWHSRPAAKINDSAFNKAAMLHGWTVWRFSEKDINTRAAEFGVLVFNFVRNHK